MSDLPQRVADGITTYSKSIILIVLLATALVGAGMPMVESDSDTEQFESESPPVEAQEYIQDNFVVEDTENQTTVQLVQRGDNVLSQDALIESLELQQELYGNELVNQTLEDEQSVFGVANILAQTQIQNDAQQAESESEAGEQNETDGQTGDEEDERQGVESEDGETDESDEQTDASEHDDEQANETQQAPPSLDEQIAALEALSEDELDALIEDVLGEDGDPQALALMASSYDAGLTTAEAHVTFVTQRTEGGSIEDPEGFGDVITESQLEIRDIAQQYPSEYTVFGFGIITEEIDQSLGDSGAIVGPLALLFVVVALTVAYRDLLDIVLGVLGILLVLVWTFGFMGWTGVAFNQLLLSVPVLLIGLSIDYAIHVFMRHREQRADEDDRRDLRRSMALALGGVGVALVWVTATAAMGFLANLTSPIGPLQDFGIVSAFGVVAALLIFGALIPALKVEIDGFLEARGLDRQKRAFGTGGSRFSSLLASGATAARRFPVAIVAVALLLTLGGAVGATQIDTSFQEEDFLADSPPSWTQHLPGAMAPGEYQAKDDIEFISENFQQEGNEGEILLRDDVTNDEVLQWIAAGTDELNEKETVFERADGEPDVQTPLTVMQQTAAEHPDSQFAEQFNAAAGEDGVPEGNIEQLFDQLLEINPDASEVIYRNDAGEYEALRMVVGVDGDAEGAAVADDLRAVADSMESESGGQLSVIATGDQVIFDNVEQDLLETVIQGLVITLVAVFAFLSIAYKLTGNPASLGIVTLLPVVFAVSWILGSMWLLDIPFNTLTGTITSLTIGLGIAYSIHISSRYELELRRQGNVWDAMQTTVTGTGGALLGSAATTVGGFGTLVFAILPVLRQFGIITGLTIIYAFLASVLILPSLLVLWTKYIGPSGYFPEDPDEKPATADSPGGTEAPADAEAGTADMDD